MEVFRAACGAVTLAGLLLITLAAPAGLAQQAVRRATTVEALVAYPTFFHGQPVRVRGELAVRDGLAWLLGGDSRVLIRTTGPDPADDEREVEVQGVFWDPGRLQPDDPRLARLNIPRAAARLLDREWPGVGEMLLVAVDGLDLAPAAAPDAVVTALAVTPERWLDQEVTVRGRFRGRNLFGDLPAAPGLSRWDFILQAADGAVWVTGIEPRGRDFRLDPQRRVDTGQWLEATGIVRSRGGLVWIEAREVRLAESDDSEPAGIVTVPIPPPPPPEVIFSAPTAEEIDVSPATNVRIQFSRDMDPESFQSRVRVTYLGMEADEGTEPAFTTGYAGANRVLEVRFDRELERFRTVRVDLLEGIRALDGSELAPWSLVFSLGG